MPAPAAHPSRIANSAAPTLEEAKAAADQLSAWLFDRCPGGPWRGMEPLGVIKEYLANPSGAEISPPAPDAVARA